MRKKALFYHIGGKNGALGEEITALFPQTEPDIYIEPFGGSFGVGIQSEYDTDKIMLIHNDLDIIVHSIFRAVTQYPERTLEAVHDLLDRFDYDQSMVDYFRMVCIYKELTGINIFEDDIYFGAAAWILKMATRNGDCKYLRNIMAGNEIEKLHRIFQNREETAFDLEGVVALHMDALEILTMIRNAGRSHDIEIFIYIDAPYSHSGKRKTRGDLYNVDIDKNDQDIKVLAELLEDINQSTECKMLVSEYENPIYNSILTAEKGWNKLKVCDVYKSMSYSGIGECKPIESEWVWKNY